MRYAIIPARGASRRIPRKNIKDFHGKPIIAYSIIAAQRSDLFDKVFVSTEDKEISEVANEYGAIHIGRPAHLAVDEVGTQEVVKMALKSLRETPDFLCCIYATCPMLTPHDLKDSFALLKRAYVYTPGWFYWGRADWFLNGKPLSQGVEYSVGERHIDINTEKDFSLAEEMYSKIHQKEAA